METWNVVREIVLLAYLGKILDTLLIKLFTGVEQYLSMSVVRKG